MDTKKIKDGFSGALRQATDTAKVVRTAMQEKSANAKQERAEKARQRAASRKGAPSRHDDAANALEHSKPPTPQHISIESTLQIIYYLMAADGTVFHSEEEKFDAIGAELDPEFPCHKEGIVHSCQLQLDKVIDSEDYLDILQEGIDEAIASSGDSAQSPITPKLLVWELLSIAYSDENYDESERKLIKHIVRRLNIDKTVFLEMENSMLTMMDIEREIAWIKTTARPYLAIEAIVKELETRTNVVFDSIKDLISL